MILANCADKMISCVNDSDQLQQVSHAPLPSDKEINTLWYAVNGLVRRTMMDDSNPGKASFVQKLDLQCRLPFFLS